MSITKKRYEILYPLGLNEHKLSALAIEWTEDTRMKVSETGMRASA